MSNIVNINFDDGFKRVVINGDEDRVIKWNPSDMNLLDRLMNLMEWIEGDLQDRIIELGVDDISDLDKYSTGSITELSEEVCEQIDKAFGPGTSQAAFQGANPISPTPSGTFIFENFIESITPLVKDSVDEYEKASSKYTKVANKHKKQVSRTGAKR